MWCVFRTILFFSSMLQLTLCGTSGEQDLNINRPRVDPEHDYNSEYQQLLDHLPSHEKSLGSILRRLYTYYEDLIPESGNSLSDDVITQTVTSFDKRSDDGEYVMGFWIPKKRGVPTSWQHHPARIPPSSSLEQNSLESWHQDYVDQINKGESRAGVRDKRYNPYRYIRRRSCDFTRLTTEHILDYLRSGRICGRRVSHVRFGLTGKK